MKNFNCLVLEDTLNDQLAIEMVLDQFPQIHATYVNTPKGFLQELSKQKYHVFIVDIMLNDSLTGIDLIHSINDTSAWVIISSSMDSIDYYEQYKSLKFNKFFIKKPIDEFIFKTNLESFLFNQKEEKTTEVSTSITPENYVMLKQGNYLYKVSYTDIILIETADHATTVYTDKNKYTTYTSLKTFEDLLKEFYFEKVNRNSLVNMRAVKRINIKENYVELDKHQVQISRSNKQLFVDKYIDKTLWKKWRDTNNNLRITINPFTNYAKKIAIHVKTSTIHEFLDGAKLYCIEFLQTFVSRSPIKIYEKTQLLGSGGFSKRPTFYRDDSQSVSRNRNALY